MNHPGTSATAGARRPRSENSTDPGSATSAHCHPRAWQRGGEGHEQVRFAGECFAFQRGECDRGRSCRFAHSVVVAPSFPAENGCVANDNEMLYFLPAGEELADTLNLAAGTTDDITSTTTAPTTTSTSNNTLTSTQNKCSEEESENLPDPSLALTSQMEALRARVRR
jgi:hypothetical protein